MIDLMTVVDKDFVRNSPKVLRNFEYKAEKLFCLSK